MSADINNVFAAFVEAQKAMNELPQVKAALYAKTGEHLITQNKLEDSWNIIDELNRQMAEAKAEIAAKEEALKSATFQEQDTKNKLDMLLGSFRSVIAEAGTAVELVDPPKPAPEPEPPVSVSSDPTESGTQNEPSTNPSGTEVSGTTLQAEDHSAGPFASSTDGQSATAPEAGSGTQTGSPTGSDVASQEPASPPKPYYSKPDTMTWHDWDIAGNELPYWVARSDSERYYSTL